MYGDIARASTWGKQRAAGRWQLAETRKSQALPAACCLLVAVALALPMSLSMLILEAATRKHWHMATEFREYDEHGFPLPPRFESVQYQDDEPPPPAQDQSQGQAAGANRASGRADRADSVRSAVDLRRPRNGFAVVHQPRRAAAAGGRLARALRDVSRAIYWNPDDLELRFCAPCGAAR